MSEKSGNGKPDLSSTYKLGPLNLPNRTVMAPMTRNRAGDGNVPGPLAATYYVQRASAGLIVTEASQVSPQGVGYPGTPGIHTDDQVKGWRQVTDAVHKAGGRIFLQLWHVGRISHPLLQPEGNLPVAPSAIAPEGETHTLEGMKPFVTPRALETEEIPGVVRQYIDGARRAKDAGFDGVEIHAANGYLIDQFLRDGTNKRDDRYGGSVENRARFLVEVTQGVVDVWGADRVGVRFSPTSVFNSMSDSDPVATFTHAAEALNRIGVAYLHVIEPVDGHFMGTDGAPEVIPHLRKVYDGTIIINGGYLKDTGNKILADGRADLVAFGTPFLANPDLPARFEADAELNIPDQGSFYGGDKKGYTDYPALGG